jgi:hypothetical protein
VDKAELRLTLEALDDGETYRGNCPFCNRAGTFTLTRVADGGVYNCYSIHCGHRGGIGNVRRPLVRPEKKEHKAKPYTEPLEELDEGWNDYLMHRIGWGSEHMAVGRPMYSPSERRVAYPIFGPMGSRRGWVLRSYSDTCDPRWKALTRLDCEEPHLSWYRVDPANLLVLVVEDIPSAVRAAVAGVPQVVAMCGGGIGPDYVQEITAFARDVVWAFDEDATKEAIRHHSRYGVYFDSSRVLPLKKDLKDMTEDELTVLIQPLISKEDKR